MAEKVKVCFDPEGDFWRCSSAMPQLLCCQLPMKPVWSGWMTKVMFWVSVSWASAVSKIIGPWKLNSWLGNNSPGEAAPRVVTAYPLKQMRL